MSLLLEALKRAEKAKEEARRRAGESAASGKDELRLADEPAPGAEIQRVLTRENLPDISQPLEILSDDLEHAAPQNDRGPGVAQQGGTHAAPATPRSRGARPAATGAHHKTERTERAAAKNVFEAKTREPNPRLPFHIAVATLGVFAIGTAAYFWYQLRPPPPLVNAHPGRSVEEKPVADTTAVGTVAQALTQPAIRGLPSGPETAAPRTSVSGTSVGRTKAAAAVPENAASAPARNVQSASRSARPPATARGSAPRPSHPIAPADPGSNAVASQPAPTLQVHPQVEAGYAAYQAGDLALAREAYHGALRDEPSNRDALLGLAAVEVRSQRPEVAEALYARLLQADPRDAYAQAGMLALRGPPQDPVLTETRLKNLLAADPEANVLYFTLGNQYARQERWAEAQQAYFKAFATDSENPDFAYNLAISLDRLHKPRIAVEYYERALALAAKRSASFDRGAVEKRVRELAP